MAVMVMKATRAMKTVVAMKAIKTKKTVRAKKFMKKPTMDVDCGNVKPAVSEIALHGRLGVHKEDVPAILEGEKIPLQIYSAGEKKYRGLREDKMEAVHRAVQVFGDNCDMSTDNTMVLLSVKFPNRGFVKYAISTLGADQEFDSMLHKNAFGDTAKDWGVWAFHGDLPHARL